MKCHFVSAMDLDLDLDVYAAGPSGIMQRGERALSYLVVMVVTFSDLTSKYF